MTRAVFAGSFDPPTNGHINIIQRAAALFDFVDVVIAVNSEKKYLFSREERQKMIKGLVASLSNVCVNIYSGLVVEYAKQTGAKVLIRGIRGDADFSYEFELSMMNRMLNPAVETLFIPAEQKYLLLKSSTIKELAALGGDISEMVPPEVGKALLAKYENIRAFNLTNKIILL